jgi:hypothetical protein
VRMVLVTAIRPSQWVAAKAAGLIMPRDRCRCVTNAGRSLV